MAIGAYEIYLSTRAEVDSFALPRLEHARKRLERAMEELAPDPYLLRALLRNRYPESGAMTGRCSSVGSACEERLLVRTRARSTDTSRGSWTRFRGSGTERSRRWFYQDSRASWTSASSIG